MDAHSQIASIWSYNKVVELEDCLKMKGNEKSPLLYGVLIFDPPFRTPKCLQFNKYCKATQILAAKCDIVYYCCLPFQLPMPNDKHAKARPRDGNRLSPLVDLHLADWLLEVWR